MKRNGVLFFISYIGLIMTQDPQLVISAFAGSIIFAVTASDFSFFPRMSLFTASMLIGITSATFSSQLISSFLSDILNAAVVTPTAVGATITSASAVRLLILLSVNPIKKNSLLGFIFRSKKWRGD